MKWFPLFNQYSMVVFPTVSVEQNKWKSVHASQCIDTFNEGRQHIYSNLSIFISILTSKHFPNRNYQQTWLRKLPSHNFYWTLATYCTVSCCSLTTPKKNKKKNLFDFHLKQNAPLSPSICCMSSALASPTDWCDSVSPACCTPASPCVFPQRPLDPMQSGPQRWAWTCPVLQGSH